MHCFYLYKQIINNVVKLFMKLNYISFIWLLRIISFMRYYMNVISVFTCHSLLYMAYCMCCYYIICFVTVSTKFSVSNTVLPHCINVSNISTCSGFPG